MTPPEEQSTSITVYETNDVPEPQDLDHPPRSFSAFSCRDLLGKPPTLIGHALRFYLLILSIEDIALCVVVITGIAPLSVMLFLFTILLQTILLIRAMCEAERHKGIREVRLYQRDIKAKFCLVAAGAWFPPTWWFLEMLIEMRGRRNRARCWSCRDPVDHERAVVATAAFVFHLLLAIVVMRLMWWGCSSLLRRLLKPKVITACRYADLPDSAFKNDGKCAICLAAFQEEDSVLHLPCRHVFHGKCLRQWLERSETCPMRCGGAVFRLPPSRKERSSLRSMLGSPAGVEAGDEALAAPEASASNDAQAEVDSELESLGEDAGLMELQAFDEPQPVTLGLLSM